MIYKCLLIANSLACIATTPLLLALFKKCANTWKSLSKGQQWQNQETLKRTQVFVSCCSRICLSKLWSSKVSGIKRPLAFALIAYRCSFPASLKCNLALEQTHFFFQNCCKSDLQLTFIGLWKAFFCTSWVWDILDNASGVCITCDENNALWSFIVPSQVQCMFAL